MKHTEAQRHVFCFTDGDLSARVETCQAEGRAMMDVWVSDVAPFVASATESRFDRFFEWYDAIVEPLALPVEYRLRYPSADGELVTEDFVIL